jgi:hypothetical protein
MPARKPPKYVPTLTEVVRGGPAVAQDSAFGEAQARAQEEIVRRVMQRVERTLDRRLREAVASVILEHTRGIAPALQNQLEATVREVVAQAFAEEQVDSGATPRPRD